MRRRKPGEPLAELCQDVRRMMTHAYPSETSSKLSSQFAKEYFMTALNDKDLELRVREREPQDLDTALKHAVRLQALAKAVNGQSTVTSSSASVPDEMRRDNRVREGRLARRVADLEKKSAAVTNDASARDKVPSRNATAEQVEALQKQIEEMNK